MTMELRTSRSIYCATPLHFLPCEFSLLGSPLTSLPPVIPTFSPSPLIHLGLAPPSPPLSLLTPPAPRLPSRYLTPSPFLTYPRPPTALVTVIQSSHPYHPPLLFHPPHTPHLPPHTLSHTTIRFTHMHYITHFLKSSHPLKSILPHLLLT